MGVETNHGLFRESFLNSGKFNMDLSEIDRELEEVFLQWMSSPLVCQQFGAVTNEAKCCIDKYRTTPITKGQKATADIDGEWR